MRPTFSGIAATLFVAALVLAPAGGQAFSLGGIFGSGVDPELVAQVPADKRGEINRADFALACANQDLDLAKLKEELADRQDDLASLGAKLAKAQVKGAETALNIAKMQAVIAQNLGQREETTTVLNDLLAARTKNEADIVQIKAKQDQTQLFIRDLTGRVAAKEKTVAEFKARRSGAAATATDAAKPETAKPAAKAETAKPAAKSEAEPVEIVNKEPGAAPEPVKPAPEADLKN